ncbi:concanavalin A-like lectin/glucanase domain-containing protein [Daedaleopsis nitida]|nr:concanavalin A-like lectin/glucanase domain-containing protein [Daedaleopsis nitida]
MRLAITLASTLFATAPAYAAYNLVKEYSGKNFFNGWEFYGNYDNLTNGDVTYVDQANATSSQLGYVNDAGNVIVKVDTGFVPYNEKRNSVRIETQDYFPLGTVLIFDATHLPFGCSVWPSFWTKGPNWPAGGEIDIIEAVNLMPANQMAIHSSSGCTASGNDCSQGAGCTVGEKSDKSYGKEFAAAGGGVWATQFDTTGINIWFWSRSDIPDSVKSATDSVDPSSWGTPSAQYSADSCDMSKFFTPQQLVIDITLCGDWAGLGNVYQQTCGGDGTAQRCYLDNVINDGSSKYADAYFEIGYIKAFSTQSLILTPTVSGGTTVLQTATSDASTPSGSAGTATGNGTSTGSNGDNNGASAAPRTYVALVTATIFSALTWIML